MSWNQDFTSTPSNTGKLIEELQNDTTVAGGPDIEELQHEPSTDLTRIIWASEPTQAEKDAAAAVVAAHSVAPEEQFHLVEATADTTTASATDVVVDSMTITPAAGTYKVTFVGSVAHGTSNAEIYPSIFAAGSKAAGSERRYKRGGGQGDVTVPFTCRAKVTVDGMQAIEGRWRTNDWTATMHERQLSIERVD